MADKIKMEVLPSAEAVARRAAMVIASEARASVAARGRFLVATSGGTTPWRMLELLAREDVPWLQLHLFQVDERVAGLTDPARNFFRLQSGLLGSVPIPADQTYPMPVDEADLETAVAQYTSTLRQIAGTPPLIDLVHLGLGADGHTASLVPGDPALDSSSEVTLAGPYQGYRRMTLTFPVIGHARRILWVVTGTDKANALLKLLQGDPAIPATRVPTQQALLLADAAAAGTQ